MPRYFFHLLPTVMDRDGVDLPNDDEARLQALQAARELSRNRSVSSGETITVTWADGSLVHRASLLVASLPNLD